MEINVYVWVGPMRILVNSVENVIILVKIAQCKATIALHVTLTWAGLYLWLIPAIV